jgi:ketosteroid isomerase-like protein
MRIFVIFTLALFLEVSGMAQNTDDSLRTQLETVHAKWLAAFEGADIATMNAIETRNIVLVLPDGFVVKNFSPRKSGELQAHPEMKDTLSTVSVRRFGDTAVLVGMATSQSPKETLRSAETVIFVLESGQWKIASAQWTDLKNAK